MCSRETLTDKETSDKYKIPEGYRIRKVTPTLLSSADFTPDAPQRFTNPDIGLFCQKIVPPDEAQEGVHRAKYGGIGKHEIISDVVAPKGRSHNHYLGGIDPEIQPPYKFSDEHWLRLNKQLLASPIQGVGTDLCKILRNTRPKSPRKPAFRPQTCVRGRIFEGEFIKECYKKEITKKLRKAGLWGPTDGFHSKRIRAELAQTDPKKNKVTQLHETEIKDDQEAVNLEKESEKFTKIHKAVPKNLEQTPIDRDKSVVQEWTPKDERVYEESSSELIKDSSDNLINKLEADSKPTKVTEEKTTHFLNPEDVPTSENVAHQLSAPRNQGAQTDSELDDKLDPCKILTNLQLYTKFVEKVPQLKLTPEERKAEMFKVGQPFKHKVIQRTLKMMEKLTYEIKPYPSLSSLPQYIPM